MSDPPLPQRRRGTPRSRRSFLLGGAAGLAAATGFPIGSDAYAAATTARGLGPGGSLLTPGSRPYPHLPAGTDTLPQIEHIVVLMMENHSFDDHLGMLGRGDGLTLGPNGQPVNYNPDPSGGFIQSFHTPNTCGEANSGISQSWDTSHICWDDGTNMGFVKGCSPAAMGYWTGEDLPFYYSMARQFPIGDRYFCSVMAQTYPNRRFLIAASAYGNIATDGTGISSTAPNGTIFERLNAYGISWKDYFPELPTVALFYDDYANNPSKCVHMTEFFKDAASGNLPAFCLVDPYTDYSEESGDISVGEAYASLFVNAVMSSPKWDKTVLIWTYDEHGGWYDHVPPAPAVKPDNVPPELQPGDYPAGYDHTGFRVPVCVVSPWAKRDHVSHVVYDHTSILKLVETKWNLPALTYRDANANNMLDFFDFSAAEPPFADPPRLAAPKNPFNGPGSLPKSSASKGFHTICTELPADSLPSAPFRLSSISASTKNLLSAHARQFANENAVTAPSSTGEIVGVAAAAVVVAGAAGLAVRARGRARSAPEPGPDLPASDPRPPL